ncbi:MAG: hypothetical protein KA116_01885 [Proteobacteria bacterium]|nr:hypothetical protein [Pseudomonadota bacterium]
MKFFLLLMSLLFVVPVQAIELRTSIAGLLNACKNGWNSLRNSKSAKAREMPRNNVAFIAKYSSDVNMFPEMHFNTFKLVSGDRKGEKSDELIAAGIVAARKAKLNPAYNVPFDFHPNDRELMIQQDFITMARSNSKARKFVMEHRMAEKPLDEAFFKQLDAQIEWAAQAPGNPKELLASSEEAYGIYKKNKEELRDRVKNIVQKHEAEYAQKMKEGGCDPEGKFCRGGSRLMIPFLKSNGIDAIAVNSNNWHTFLVVYNYFAPNEHLYIDPTVRQIFDGAEKSKAPMIFVGTENEFRDLMKRAGISDYGIDKHFRYREEQL